MAFFQGDSSKEDLSRPSHSSPAAIGFYVGVSFGFFVVLIFIIISIVACCSQDDAESSSQNDHQEIVNSNLDGLDVISIKSTRPSSRLSSKSGSVVLVKHSNEDDKIEVIEEIDETQSIQDII